MGSLTCECIKLFKNPCRVIINHLLLFLLLLMLKLLWRFGIKDSGREIALKKEFLEDSQEQEHGTCSNFTVFGISGVYRV